MNPCVIAEEKQVAFDLYQMDHGPKVAHEGLARHW